MALSFATLVIVASHCIFPCFGVASCIAIFRLLKGFLTARGVYKKIFLKYLKVLRQATGERSVMNNKRKYGIEVKEAVSPVVPEGITA